MTLILDSTAPDFPQAFEALLGSKRESSPEVDRQVADILKDVKARGDAALLELTERFDRMTLSPEALRITSAEIDDALAATPGDVRDALGFAHERISSHHRKQLPEDHRYTDALGVTLGMRWTPVDSVGLYVPGGLASYPSSVLMNAVPARVAGVDRLAMVVPTPEGRINPAILAAASIAGVDEIYRVGGAQAIAALAYGTATISPVAKIVGPGNAYVATAKKQVFGTVGIDMIAGPSEVLIIADETADARWVAADLLAQAEHGAGAQSILVTTSAELARAVPGEVERQLQALRSPDTAREGWESLGAIITVPGLEEAVGLANRIASEHVELMVAEPEALSPRIRHAGAIFIGHHTPEAIGDYVGGSNHVLPTARSARFASGLGVLDFMKRTSILSCTPEALGALADAAVTLAETENLEAHGRSVSIRRNG
ncbi:histidinol dehydrogenase [Pelagibacterium montanilacus]|uniref:histidinol dehydrogenase n=1 Tax=Pelagibacterium montanilacus TaxID=2185280 RepID=UPI000F8F4750|nr:histidinol dehydrogenase [Pelagibacterium montanilacus]